jgi:hypothetical protein
MKELRIFSALRKFSDLRMVYDGGAWRRSRKCKILLTDGQTDDEQRAIRIAHLSFQLR